MNWEVIHLFMWVIGGLLSVLVLIIGFVGVRIHSRLDAISTTLNSIERDLREEVSELGNRVTRVETLYQNITGARA